MESDALRRSGVSRTTLRERMRSRSLALTGGTWSGAPGSSVGAKSATVDSLSREVVRRQSALALKADIMEAAREQGRVDEELVRGLLRLGRRAVVLAALRSAEEAVAHWDDPSDDRPAAALDQIARHLAGEPVEAKDLSLAAREAAKAAARTQRRMGTGAWTRASSAATACAAAARVAAVRGDLRGALAPLMDCFQAAALAQQG